MSTLYYACTFSFDPALVGDDAAIRAQAVLSVREGRGLGMTTTAWAPTTSS